MNTSLETKQPPAGPPGDPVELWKRWAASHAEQTARVNQGALGLRVDGGFALIGLASGAVLGAWGPLESAALAASLVFAQELPRALLARALGRSVRIELGSAGCNARVLGRPLTGGARLAFAGIGSLGNAALALAAASFAHAGAARGPVLLEFAGAQASWGLAQLLPVRPFHAGAALAERLRPVPRFVHASLSVLVLCAAAVAYGAARTPTALVVASLVLGASIFSARDAHAASADAETGVERGAARVEAMLHAGDGERAGTLAEQLLHDARSAPLRARLWKAKAWAAIGRGDPFSAHAAIEHLPRDVIDVQLVAAYLSCCNRTQEAVALIERERALHIHSRETTRLLIDLLYRRGELERLRDIANEDRELLGPDELLQVASALADAPH